MTTVSLGRSMPNRWRAHAALGTAAAAMVGVATVVVGAQLIGVTPPYCPGHTSACSPARIHSSHTALTRSSRTDPRCGIPGRRPGRSPARTPAVPSDPMAILGIGLSEQGSSTRFSADIVSRRCHPN